MAWNSLVAGTAGGGNQGPMLRIAFLEEESAAMGATLRDLTLSRDNLLQVRLPPYDVLLTHRGLQTQCAYLCASRSVMSVNLTFSH
jgi:hypothetical protein